MIVPCLQERLRGSLPLVKNAFVLGRAQLLARSLFYASNFPRDFMQQFVACLRLF
jgi:hypothetical protein